MGHLFYLVRFYVFSGVIPSQAANVGYCSVQLSINVPTTWMLSRFLEISTSSKRCYLFYWYDPNPSVPLLNLAELRTRNLSRRTLIGFVCRYIIGGFTSSLEPFLLEPKTWDIVRFNLWFKPINSMDLERLEKQNISPYSCPTINMLALVNNCC